MGEAYGGSPLCSCRLPGVSYHCPGRWARRDWACHRVSGDDSRMNSDMEVQRAVIGVLTLMGTADDGTSDEEFDRLLESAIGPGLFDYGFKLSTSVRPGSTADLEALAIDVARQVGGRLAREAVVALGFALRLFHMLAAECPGVDVEAFLRQRALEVAAGDEAM